MRRLTLRREVGAVASAVAVAVPGIRRDRSAGWTRRSSAMGPWLESSAAGTAAATRLISTVAFVSVGSVAGRLFRRATRSKLEQQIPMTSTAGRVANAVQTVSSLLTLCVLLFKMMIAAVVLYVLSRVLQPVLSASDSFSEVKKTLSSLADRLPFHGMIERQQQWWTTVRRRLRDAREQSGVPQWVEAKRHAVAASSHRLVQRIQERAIGTPTTCSPPSEAATAVREYGSRLSEKAKETSTEVRRKLADAAARLSKDPPPPGR